MSLVAEQYAFMLDVAKLIQFCASEGIVVTGGELHRTPEQQQIYVKTGKSKTLNSKHLERLAIDLNFFVNGVLCYDVNKVSKVGKYWEGLSPKNSAGMFWKSFVDLPHFERRV